MTIDDNYIPDDGLLNLGIVLFISLILMGLIMWEGEVALRTPLGILRRQRPITTAYMMFTVYTPPLLAVLFGDIHRP